MGTQQFSLKWRNHQRNMLTTFECLLSNETLVDVTLACEGMSLKAHKMVLSASSPFFQSLFLENPCKHPIVIMKDIKFSHLKAIIEFVYRGEVSVPQDQLAAFLKTAEALKVKGLTSLSDEDNWQVAGTSVKNEQHYFLPLDSSNVETCIEKSNHFAINDENISSRTQEQRFPSTFAQSQGILPVQASSLYPEFNNSIFPSSCSSLQDDTKINSNQSATYMSQEKSADIPLTNAQPVSQLNISTVALSQENNQELAAYNNETLFPNITRMLSGPSSPCPVTKREDLSYPSTSSFGSVEKQECDDSYLDCLDASENANSRSKRNDKVSKRLIGSLVERPFACNICGKRFLHKSNLKSHQETHAGYKLFKCDICGTRFTRSMDLARHHLIHTGEKPFACDICGKKFNRKFLVQRHERLVHHKIKNS